MCITNNSLKKYLCNNGKNYSWHCVMHYLGEVFVSKLRLANKNFASYTTYTLMRWKKSGDASRIRSLMNTYVPNTVLHKNFGTLWTWAFIPMSAVHQSSNSLPTMFHRITASISYATDSHLQNTVTKLQENAAITHTPDYGEGIWGAHGIKSWLPWDLTFSPRGGG